MTTPPDTPHNSHDALVRTIFGLPQHAASELRAVLPAALLAQLDLDSLTRVEASFVDEALRSSAADLLYRVLLRDGRLALVYLLIEHQSTFDPRMPLRLLGYLTRIWERHAREHPEDPKLPPIVPIVIHHGPRPWPGSRRFGEALLARLPGFDIRDSRDPADGVIRSDVLPLDFGFIVDDLALLQDPELLGRGRDTIAKLTWLALRNGRASARFFELMVDAIRSLEADLRGPEAVPALAALASYVCRWIDAPISAVERTIAESLPPASRSDFMNMIDQWIEKGRLAGLQKGRVEGRTEGRTEGELAARRESLLAILESRFGTVDAIWRERIATATSGQLASWIRRGAVTNSLDAVFAE
ncbi:MAG: hypothetical protein EXS13_06115 [Planctomycetes bacterium]|nr:hypothetical protein [Planctomycetota bacterium]